VGAIIAAVPAGVRQRLILLTPIIPGIPGHASLTLKTVRGNKSSKAQSINLILDCFVALLLAMTAKDRKMSFPQGSWEGI
jgi:hypothetical protein